MKNVLKFSLMVSLLMLMVSAQVNAQSCCVTKETCKVVAACGSESQAAATKTSSDAKEDLAKTTTASKSNLMMVSPLLTVLSAITSLTNAICDPSKCDPTNCPITNCDPTKCDLSKCILKPEGSAALKLSCASASVAKQ